jgi:uncharacterized protein
MMKYFFKLLLLVLLTSSVLFAESFQKPDFDPRLNIDSRATMWFNHADTDSISAFNIGLLYDIKIKDYKKAEQWYKLAWSIDKNKDALINLGILYDDNLNEPKKAEYWYKVLLKLEPNNSDGLFNLALLYKAKLNNPKLAIKYYKQSYALNNISAANNLGYLYEDLKNYKEAEKWYEKAIERESLASIKNLGRLYHFKLNDDVKAAEYFIALINNKYPKEKVLGYLKNKWKLSDQTIKKGYEAQLKSKIIPEKLKYKGGI